MMDFVALLIVFHQNSHWLELGKLFDPGYTEKIGFFISFITLMYTNLYRYFMILLGME